MEQTIYRGALFLTGLINLVMAFTLLKGSKSYRPYAIYYRTRLLTTLWIAVFGLGYIVHGIFMWRYTWPTVARSICRRLGGDIVLDTSYTGGARFVMTLPVS